MRLLVQHVVADGFVIATYSTQILSSLGTRFEEISEVGKTAQFTLVIFFVLMARLCFMVRKCICIPCVLLLMHVWQILSWR